MDNIRGLLLEIAEDILVLSESEIIKIVINFETFFPLNVKFLRVKGYSLGAGKWLLPLMGPFGLAASSLGALASEIKRKLVI